MSLCSKCKYRRVCADRRDDYNFDYNGCYYSEDDDDLDPILTLAGKFRY